MRYKHYPKTERDFLKILFKDKTNFMLIIGTSLTFIGFLMNSSIIVLGTLSFLALTTIIIYLKGEPT